MEILKLNSISKKADTVFKGYDLVGESEAPVGVLVRSFNMHNWQPPASLLGVARAGAGVNNIPFEEYASKGICVFNTPGANANAVKELVIASMIMASRNLYRAISWAQTLSGENVAVQVEKGKGSFAGSEILGKTLCVLGLGAIGRKVAAAANALGMKVLGYDPYINLAGKEEIPFVELIDTAAEAVAQADFITLHMPMTGETKAMINARMIEKMKDGVIIVNAARGELVSVADVISGIACNKIRCYVTDFPDPESIGANGIVTTPHLGASTEEAEDNCAIMAAEQLKDYIENGNIKNSVNLPTIWAERGAAHRVSIISVEGTKLPCPGCSATRNGIKYTLIDSDEEMDISALSNVEGVIRVRSIY